MGIRHCPHCGGELGAATGICPSCGAATPSPGSVRGVPAPATPQRSFSLGALAGVLSVLLVLAIVLLVVRGMQHVTHSNSAARGGESKQDLNTVQRAVEKYRTDQGQYPTYLIGGEARYADSVAQGNSERAFIDIRDCNRGQVSDPLLREGYLEQYPANPFLKNGLTVHMLQQNLPGSMMGGDPLRNDSKFNSGAMQLGTRFGARCTTMGNVLADPRYPTWVCQQDASGKAMITNFNSGADVEYRYWDLWRGDRPLPFLVGEFFYKSAGPIVAASDMERPSAGLPLPTSVDYYILGAYGAATDRGQDVIGPEPQLRIDLGARGSRTLFPWTRSTTGFGGVTGNMEGSPYGAAPDTNSPCYPFTYGNPNGIDDAIILVLTAQ